MALVGGRHCLGCYCGPHWSERLVTEEVLLSPGSTGWRPMACVGGAPVRTRLGQVSGDLLLPLLGHMGGTACRQGSYRSHSLSPRFPVWGSARAPSSLRPFGPRLQRLQVGCSPSCSRLRAVLSPALWLATVPKHLGCLLSPVPHPRPPPPEQDVSGLSSPGWGCAARQRGPAPLLRLPWGSHPGLVSCQAWVPILQTRRASGPYFVYTLMVRLSSDVA